MELDVTVVIFQYAVESLFSYLGVLSASRVLIKVVDKHTSIQHY